MKSIKLTENGDLDFSNFGLQTIEGVDLAVQTIKRRLQGFRNTWFLNPEAGLPYFESIFGKNRDVSQIEEIFIREINSIDLVKKILEISAEVDHKERTIKVYFSVMTIYNEVASSNLVLSI